MLVKSPPWYNSRGWSGLMNHLENFLSWSTLSFEIVVCGFVFVRKVHRILPFFALYTCVILASTVGVWLTYTISGYTSLTSYYAYWGSVLLNAATRSLAIVELCRYGLRAYRGIWALAWYVLTTVSILLLAHAAIDTWGQPDKVAIYGATLDRDLAFASLVVLAVLFLFRKYYAIPLESPQRGIAAGICFICAFDVVMSTILRNVYAGYLFDWFLESEKARWPALRAQFLRVNDIWSAFHLFFFMFGMGIWCFALRKPVPMPAESPVLLPAEVYREMSPAINMRLATFNDRMTELLKP